MSSKTTRLRNLSFFSLLEASTLLVLFMIAVPLKYMAGYKLGVSVVGPIHGLVFLSFCWNVLNSVTVQDISQKTGWKFVLAACLPFGGLFTWQRLRRQSDAADAPAALD